MCQFLGHPVYIVAGVIALMTYTVCANCDRYVTDRWLTFVSEIVYAATVGLFSLQIILFHDNSYTAVIGILLAVVS